MTIALKHLEYGMDSLEPAISAKTMNLHYGKHYAGYVETLARLIEGTDFENMALEEIVLNSANKPDLPAQKIFDNAAQAWNHEFFWDSLAPNGGGEPPDPVRRALEESFGTMEAFKTEFVGTAVKQFGSGWTWLVAKDDGLYVMSTSNAQIPPRDTCRPLMVCDVWEHAYYLDYQNEREKFVRAFLDDLVNWQFVGLCMAEHGARRAA